ncbi:importin-4 [Protopterus annectens]|uniref:importin-4 n=1 Tax=Protopterus annectens TaxID=7888 RepID=UPI001CFB3C5D|nr:importin-4 [Protopterus annectens]
MAEQLENVLHRLLQPDNAVIQQATAELKVAFRDPSVVPALCCILTRSANAQIRQFAAVLMRRRVGKQWRKLAPEMKESILEWRVEVVSFFICEKQHCKGALSYAGQPNSRFFYGDFIHLIATRYSVTIVWKKDILQENVCLNAGCV